MLAWAVGFIFFPGAVRVLGRDGEAAGPSICVMAPLGVPAGTNSTLQIRGLKLTGATRVSVVTSDQIIPASIREKKTAAVPSGLDAKTVGDSLAVVEIEVPPGLAGAELMIRVVTLEGTTQARPLRVMDGNQVMEEKEPNDGFREAQPWPLEKRMSGAIGRDKDVDVFAINGHARKTLVAECLAARGGSLLDGALTLYDEKGRVLTSNDDHSGGRDPQLRFQLPADGKYFLALQDTGDRGTAWHGYELTAREEP